MENFEIQKILTEALPLQEIYISKDGNHFKIIVVSEIFTDMSHIEKQKTVYKPLVKYITNNSIHALSIKAYTPKEWNFSRKMNNF